MDTHIALFTAASISPYLEKVALRLSTRYLTCLGCIETVAGNLSFLHGDVCECFQQSNCQENPIHQRKDTDVYWSQQLRDPMREFEADSPWLEPVPDVMCQTVVPGAQ